MGLPEPRDPRQSPHWRTLESSVARLRGLGLQALLESRGVDLLSFEGLHVDFSKNFVDREAWRALYGLADDAGLAQMREAMFSGAAINRSEARAVTHAALRAAPGEIVVEGEDLGLAAASARARMRDWIEAAHAGARRGATGERFEALVHVGLGGSEVGPRLLHAALPGQLRDDVELRFVTGLDGSELERQLEGLDPARTLVCVASKSFSTLETLTNAESIRAWLRAGLLASGATAEAAWAKHFVGVTARAARAQAWGLDPEQIFELWESVGGRFSVSSAISFPLVFAAHPGVFEAFCEGARAMDRHFVERPWAENLPVRLALLGFYYGAFFDARTRCVVPYDERLEPLVTYLRQTQMESNGKSVDADGRPLVGLQTAPVVWGGPGIEGQHTFFQMLHQGTQFIPVEFVAVVQPEHAHAQHHELLLSSCLAQAQALMVGRDGPEVAPYRRFEGNRPSTVILLEALTPRALGSLVAMYEHEAFVQGVLWGINSFDQWGVELGKELTGSVLAALREVHADEGADEGPGGEPAQEDAASSMDASTRALVARIRHATST